MFATHWPSVVVDDYYSTTTHLQITTRCSAITERPRCRAR